MVEVMRTIVDLPEPQIAALGELCRERGLSRAEAVRQAVDAFLKEQITGHHSAFGLWTRHQVAEDGLAYQQRMREEWQ